MKWKLRMVAAVLVLASVNYWLFTGANPGWTKTSVPKPVVDEITGITGVIYQRKFVPGVDFLVVMGLGAGLLTGISFLVRDKKSQK